MKCLRKMLSIATLLLVVAIAAPLFAGYCLTCTTGNCAYYDPACSPRTLKDTVSYCVACGPSGGYYYCTDCFFEQRWCEKWRWLPLPGWVQCSSPPYIWIVIEENNGRRTWPPYSCIWIGDRYRCW